MKLINRLTLMLFIFSGVANSQTTEITGRWQLSKVEVGNQTHDNLKAIYVFAQEGIIKASRSQESEAINVGTWNYNSNKKLLKMKSAVDKDFNGEASVLSVNNKSLVFKKEGAILYFNRLLNKVAKASKVSIPVEIEKLDFTMDDFFDENEEYKYYDDEEKLPWNNPLEMLQSLTNVKQLIYHYSKVNTEGEMEENKTLTANVEANVDKQSLSIDFIFYGYDRYNLPDDADLPPNNEYTKLLYPEKENAFRVVGNELITIQAGTFDCTVIEVAGEHEECRKLWMMTNKPAVYVKIIVAKPGDWGYYAVYELQDIK